MNIGYIRVSTQEQNTIRQELLMKELGVDQLFIDKASGKDTDRPALKAMLDLVEQLTQKQAEFISRKEAIDTTTPSGKFMLTIFGAVAELEREYILQRQREGIAIAKAQGKYTGRKPITHPDFLRVTQRWHQGEITAVDAMHQLGMPSSTFYRKVKSVETS